MYHRWLVDSIGEVVLNKKEGGGSEDEDECLEELREILDNEVETVRELLEVEEESKCK